MRKICRLLYTQRHRHIQLVFNAFLPLYGVPLLDVNTDHSRRTYLTLYFVTNQLGGIVCSESQRMISLFAFRMLTPPWQCHWLALYHPSLVVWKRPGSTGTSYSRLTMWVHYRGGGWAIPGPDHRPPLLGLAISPLPYHARVLSTNGMTSSRAEAGVMVSHMCKFLTIVESPIP